MLHRFGTQCVVQRNNDHGIGIADLFSYFPLHAVLREYSDELVGSRFCSLREQTGSESLYPIQHLEMTSHALRTGVVYFDWIAAVFMAICQYHNKPIHFEGQRFFAACLQIRSVNRMVHHRCVTCSSKLIFYQPPVWCYKSPEYLSTSL